MNKKILHITMSDDHGGAAIAAYRLHDSMLLNGIDSKMLVVEKNRTDESIHTFYNNEIGMYFYKFKLYCLGNKNYIKKDNIGFYSNFWLGSPIKNISLINEADVIYIHWICKGVLSYKNILYLMKKGKKVIWMMHDMFPVTGGCHHSFDCVQYTNDCLDCPFWGKRRKAYNQLKSKKSLLRNQNLYWIAPSKWLFNCAINSSAVNNERLFLIPNQMSKNFIFLDKNFSRKALGLKNEKKYILYGADGIINNPYKGFNYFLDSLKKLYSILDSPKDTIEILIFGTSFNEKLKIDIPFSTTFLGEVKDERTMNLIYNSANLMVITSIAENYPLTVQESILSGTPVVGFDVGGISDIVDSLEKGKLVNPFDTNALSLEIKNYLYIKTSININSEKLYIETINKHKKLIFDL